jgi:hypothetical protein
MIFQVTEHVEVPGGWVVCPEKEWEWYPVVSFSHSLLHSSVHPASHLVTGVRSTAHHSKANTWEIKVGGKKISFIPAKMEG